MKWILFFYQLENFNLQFTVHFSFISFPIVINNEREKENSGNSHRDINEESWKTKKKKMVKEMNFFKC